MKDLKKNEKITVEMVAAGLGVSPQKIREQMKSGKMKLGYPDTSENGVTTYIMTPKHVYDATGLKFNGYEPPAVIVLKDEKTIAREMAAGILQAFSLK